jgi:hypothetical protein
MQQTSQVLAAHYTFAFLETIADLCGRFVTVPNLPRDDSATKSTARTRFGSVSYSEIQTRGLVGTVVLLCQFLSGQVVSKYGVRARIDD